MHYNGFRQSISHTHSIGYLFCSIGVEPKFKFTDVTEVDILLIFLFYSFLRTKSLRSVVGTLFCTGLKKKIRTPPPPDPRVAREQLVTHH